MAILNGVLTADLGGAPIPGLFNTGVSDVGMILPVNSPERHFAMSGLGTNATVITPAPPWSAAPAGSAWIGPRSGLENAPSGCCYVYTLTFDLSGLDSATAVITGQLASDDETQILINGRDVPFDNRDITFQALRPFTVAGGFRAGMNTLEFRVFNCADPACSFNPSGILISGLAGTAALGPPNLYVATISGGGAVLGYSVTTGSAVLTRAIRDPAINIALDVAFSRWGELFISTSSQHPYLFEERPGFVRRLVPPYGVDSFNGDLGVGALVTPHGLAFRNDELLATDVGHNRVRRYRFGPRGEAEELSPITSPGLVNEAIRWVTARPDGSEVFVSQCNCSGQNNVRRFRAETNGTFTDLGLLPGSFNNPHGMAFSPWGELFTANSDLVLQGPQYTNWYITRHTFDSNGVPQFNGSFSHTNLRGSLTLAFSPWGELFVNNQTASNITRFVFSLAHEPVFNGSISLPADGAGLAFRRTDDCASAPVPRVVAGLSGTDVSLRFPATASGYALDWADSLRLPMVWRPSYAERLGIGPDVQVLLPRLGGTNRGEFFRLRCSDR